MIDSRIDRLLRGGSGGGGSSGGGSSGGYYGGDGGNGSNGGALPIWVPIVAGIAGFFGLVFYICKYRTHRRNKAEFEEAVSKAKADVEQKSRATLSYERLTPHSGEYTTEYVDRGTTRTGTITLTFNDESSDGYILSGNGVDCDGESIITEGQANYDGTAFWKEKTKTGDVGMQVLSTGKFDFKARTFIGEWHSSTGIKGTYTSFSAKEEPPATTPTESISTEEDHQDIDTVMDPDYELKVSAAPSKY